MGIFLRLAENSRRFLKFTSKVREGNRIHPFLRHFKTMLKVRLLRCSCASSKSSKRLRIFSTSISGTSSTWLSLSLMLVCVYVYIYVYAISSDSLLIVKIHCLFSYNLILFHDYMIKKLMI